MKTLIALDAAIARVGGRSGSRPLALGDGIDDDDKDELKGEQGVDLLLGGLRDKLKQ